MSISKSIILNTDSYKTSMFLQMPKGTTGVYSYIESRGGRYDETVFFGLQAFIKEYLLTPIEQSDIDIAEAIITDHGEPFNRAGWQYILDKHAGYLPVVIRAVPEGTVVPVKNVLATIENTDPECFWLTTYLETALLRAVWYGTTVATQSKSIKNTIAEYLEKTGDHTNMGENAMLIQITDPAYYPPIPKHNFKSIAQFEFLDAEDEDIEKHGYDEGFLISDEQASMLVGLLQHALDNSMNVLVHCHAGICRSGAVVEVGSMMGFTPTDRFRQPNIRVKTKMMKVLGWTYE